MFRKIDSKIIYFYKLSYYGWYENSIHLPFTEFVEKPLTKIVIPTVGTVG